MFTNARYYVRSNVSLLTCLTEMNLSVIFSQEGIIN